MLLALALGSVSTHLTTLQADSLVGKMAVPTRGAAERTAITGFHLERLTRAANAEVLAFERLFIPACVPSGAAEVKERLPHPGGADSR